MSVARGTIKGAGPARRGPSSVAGGPRIAAVIGWSLLSLFAGSGAWADESARSIMFEPLDAERRDLTTLPAEREADRGERCTALARELEALKGKPQRRYAVSQQFEAECGR